MQLQKLNPVEGWVLRKEAMKFLAKHWGSIASILAGIGGYIDWNAVAAFSSAHKGTAAGILVAAFLTLYNARAPKDKVNQ